MFWGFSSIQALPPPPFLPALIGLSKDPWKPAVFCGMFPVFCPHAAIAVPLHPGPSVEKDRGTLSPVAVKSALANPGTYKNGDGLFVKVGKTGSASRLLRPLQDGKRRDIGVRSARLVTLAEAREKANGLRKVVKVAKRDVPTERKDEAAAKLTFRGVAIQGRNESEAGRKSMVYARQWLASLENYAFPKPGDMPTGSISRADIIIVLTPIWQEIPKTAP